MRPAWPNGGLKFLAIICCLLKSHKINAKICCNLNHYHDEVRPIDNWSQSVFEGGLPNRIFRGAGNSGFAWFFYTLTLPPCEVCKSDVRFHISRSHSALKYKNVQYFFLETVLFSNRAAPLGPEEWRNYFKKCRF